MYHLIVEQAQRKMSELVPTEDNDFMEVFKEPLDKECVEFSVGNPRVEHITGIVHLYKRNDPVYGSREPWKATPDISEVKSSNWQLATRLHEPVCLHPVQPTASPQSEVFQVLSIKHSLCCCRRMRCLRLK
jgi:hypothetical protein